MTYKMVRGVPVWGDPIENAVDQIIMVAEGGAQHVALMADHHLGYSMPIGGVAAYWNKVSPSGVGYDIACGNKAVRLNVSPESVKENIDEIMDEIWNVISFGIGRKNEEIVEHPLFDDDLAWDIPVVSELRELAQQQLGTIGSGNHFVDLFVSERGDVWIGVHFGSRGFGHKIATHYVKAGGGKDGMFVEPVLLSDDTDLGREYIAAMRLAGRYAYAGRDWVCQKVADIIGGDIEHEVHNHHNFAWKENHFGNDIWVVRKGSTPAFPNQQSFIGGTMGDVSFIVRGVDHEESKISLYSTIHGAGRIMSRTRAAGKKKWKHGRPVRVGEGLISREMMMEWVDGAGVALRGAGTDESPQAYKRIEDVISSHENTLVIDEVLHPIGVAMAGENEYDPFKD